MGSTAVPDASSAAATVRAFLATAVLDGNAYAACQYLAPSEQQVVAALAGEGQSCRAALSVAEPSLAAGERSAFHAPSAAWRIVSGATALLA